MAQTIGYVVAIRDNGHATVAAEKTGGCCGCSGVSQCHGGQRANSRPTPALNRAGAAVGDRVTLTVASGAILARMAVLYLVPVGMMLIGAFMGAFLFNGTQDDHSVALGLAGFLLGFILSVVISRIWSSARPVVPVITRIVNTRMNTAVPRPPNGCGCGTNAASIR